MPANFLRKYAEFIKCQAVRAEKEGAADAVHLQYMSVRVMSDADLVWKAANLPEPEIKIVETS